MGLPFFAERNRDLLNIDLGFRAFFAERDRDLLNIDLGFRGMWY